MQVIGAHAWSHDEVIIYQDGNILYSDLNRNVLEKQNEGH